VSLAPANDKKEQIRQAIDIVDLVGGYVNLRRAGSKYKGLCPFHDDSNPSFEVSPARQSWKCWVCDKGGDVFSFMMEKEGVEFREALQMLAERAGVSLEDSRPAAAPGSPEDKQTLFRAAKWAEEQFNTFLMNSPQAESAREYLTKRGVTNASIERYAVGYADNNWQWMLDRAKTTAFSPAILKAVGLVRQSENGRYYDMYRGRVIFPIRDAQSRTIAFGGRILPELAVAEEKANGRPPGKYINSPETRLFSKSEQVYGLDLVREAVSKSRHVVVVEGYTDALMAGQYGVDNVVAVLGTALGEKHIRLFKRFADRVTLVLDGDEAGQRRTNEVLSLFVAAQMDLRILTLPDQLDPCDFVQQHGAEAFNKLVAGASDALDHKVHIATRGVDLVNDTHKANLALEDILDTLAHAPRSTLGAGNSNSLREQQLLSRLSRQFRVDDEHLRRRLKELRTRRGSTAGASKIQLKPQRKLSLGAREMELFEILTQHPELTSHALSEIRNVDLADGPARKIYALYRSHFNAGESVEFPRLLSELPPELQPLFVAIDDIAAAKADESFADPATRLRELIDGIRQSHKDQALKAKLDQLDGLNSSQGDNETDLEILKEVFQQERHRRGISSPTDG